MIKESTLADFSLGSCGLERELAWPPSSDDVFGGLEDNLAGISPAFLLHGGFGGIHQRM
jgi:hypothetical protein